MKKTKFNFIDVLIAIVAVAAVVVIVFMYNSKTSKKTSGNGGELIFTVEVTEVDKNYTESLEIGDHVIFGTSSSDEATVTAFEFRPSERLESDIVGGNFYISKNDKLFDAYVTMKANATKDADDIKIGTTEVKTGDSFEAKAKGAGEERKAYLINGYVMDMKFTE